MRLLVRTHIEDGLRAVEKLTRTLSLTWRVHALSGSSLCYQAELSTAAHYTSASSYGKKHSQVLIPKTALGLEISRNKPRS